MDSEALILKEIMEEAGRSFLKVVPVEAEVVIANSWAEKRHRLLTLRYLPLIYYQSILWLAGDITYKGWGMAFGGIQRFLGERNNRKVVNEALQILSSKTNKI